MFTIFYNKKVLPRASEPAQWIKGLATKPDILSLIPRAHIVEGKNQLLYVVL